MTAILVAVAAFPAGVAVGLRVRQCQIRAVRDQWMWTRWRNVCIQRALNRQLRYQRRLP